jgi:excisionase family DNA binding protein
MKKPPFFSQNDLGIVAKCLGGMLKTVSGLKGKALATQFRVLYAGVASNSLGRQVILAHLEDAYQQATGRQLSDSILLNRFDKFTRYSEVNPIWADRVKQAMIQLPTKSTRISNVKNPAPVPATVITMPVRQPKERFVTATRVARHFSFSKSMVYRLAREGSLTFHRVGRNGRNIRFRLSEVDRDITVVHLPLK